MVEDAVLSRVRGRLEDFVLDKTWKWSDEVLLTADEARYLRRWHLPVLVEEVVPCLVDLVQRDIKVRGWVNPPPKESARWVLEHTRKLSAVAEKQGHLSSLSRTGVSLMRAHFTAYWKTQGGALETCLDADALRKIVAYRVGLNNSNEVWAFTRKVLLRGLISGRKVPSLFKPVPAAAIYRSYLGDAEAPVVWDPSGGFGGRLLGFYAVYPNGRYIANEPASLTAHELRTLLGRGEIIENGSEREGPTCPVDLVFTSPPYFDKERYFDEPGQCWRDYPTQEQWVQRYLAPTISRGAAALRQGGHLVFNVDTERAPLVAQCAQAAGLSFVREHKLHIGIDHFGRKQGHDPRTEPVLVFRKESAGMTVCVPGTSGRYTISDQGAVRSYTRSWKGADLGGTVMATGYRSVGITAEPGGRARTHLVHRLVCHAFHGDPPSPEHTDVRHLNGDKLDNRAENLAWGTRSENMQDVVAHRTAAEGAAVRAAAAEAKSSGGGPGWYRGRVLDEGLVKVCVELVGEKKLAIKDVARLLDCSPTVARNLVRGHAAYSPEKVVAGKKRRTPAQRAQICELIQAGHDRKAVNEALGETLTHQDFYYYKSKALA